MVVQDMLIIIFMTGGAFFAFVAALGMLRMPDLYMRLSAATKASTLGVSFILLATAIFFNDLGVTGEVVAIIAFIILTAPVAAHMIGRAAYFNKVPLWKKSAHDEMTERRDALQRKKQKDE